MRYVDDLQFHGVIGKQLQRSAGPAFRWFAVGDLDEPGFAGTVQFPGNRGFIAELPVQHRIESLRDKRFADVEYGLGVTPDTLGNLGIRFVGMEQDVGIPDRGGRRFAAVDEALEERTLAGGKGNGVLPFPMRIIQTF